MQTSSVLLILLAALVALAIVLFQYFYKNKGSRKQNVILSLLRFIGIFGILLLLINPKFTKTEYRIEKTNLVVLVDNSSSLKEINNKTNIDSLIKKVSGNSVVLELFNLHTFSFGNSLEVLDSLTFSKKSTNIADAINASSTMFDNSNSVAILISDGNQTVGEDYEYNGTFGKMDLYPMVVGDTTSYDDIRISQVNANKYAFLKNKFPIETYITYDGKGSINTLIKILMDGRVVATEAVKLSNTDNSKRILTLLEANSVGVKEIKITASPLSSEKNTTNNQRELALEVIDEKTNVAIISDILHPDIGALTKAIESNEQRNVVLYKSNTELETLDDIDLFILYQPTRSFKPIYNFIATKGVQRFTVTGSKTDWGFLNSVQNSFEKTDYNQTEEIFPVLNPDFTIFNNAEFSVDNYPPLEGDLGEILITKPHETLMDQRIKGIDVGEPLLAILTDGAKKEAVLFGENIWKWRMQSFRNDRSFDNFDELMGKLILYLATNNAKERLTLDYNAVFSGAGDAKIKATYFDKTYLFDGNASLNMNIKRISEDTGRDLPMLLKNGYYEVDLQNLTSGSYEFRVDVQNENISKTGQFKILDFDVEKQFLSSNYKKMGRLAQNSNGQLYYADGMDSLINQLVNDKRYLPSQVGTQNVVSLIDFRILLALIAAAFSAEWFLRKYNGLS
ncbi:VWA domain-containing protein [Sediminicola sp. 1XM1-17]|uniref:VWA domain-containing protein n=1 Tax=Sediminicola sp. 1XM1-17 TaxID=3127702 RepID=UPI003076D40B